MFCLGDAADGGPCQSGWLQGQSVLDSAAAYTLAGLLEAGLDVENVEWLVLHKARTSPETLDGVRRWVRLLDGHCGDADHFNEVQRALRRAWAAAVKALIRSGIPQSTASRQTTARYREALQRAFA